MSKTGLIIVSILLYIIFFLIELYIGVRLWNECLVDLVNVKEITPLSFFGLMILGRILTGGFANVRTKTKEGE